MWNAALWASGRGKTSYVCTYNVHVVQGQPRRVHKKYSCGVSRLPITYMYIIYIEKSAVETTRLAHSNYKICTVLWLSITAYY